VKILAVELHGNRLLHSVASLLMLSRQEGMRKSVALLQNFAPSEASDYKPQEF
jgi:hypothetical protein